MNIQISQTLTLNGQQVTRTARIDDCDKLIFVPMTEPTKELSSITVLIMALLDGLKGDVPK